MIDDPNAPVTIVEYTSMKCGHCANFHENSYSAIKADYIVTGKVKLIIREFPSTRGRSRQSCWRAARKVIPSVPP